MLVRPLLTAVLTTGITAAIGASGALATDYRAEIIEHVIAPCLLQGAKDHGLDKKLGEDRAVEVLSFVHAVKAEFLISAVVPLLEGKDEGARLAVYARSQSQCVQNMCKR